MGDIGLRTHEHWIAYDKACRVRDFRFKNGNADEGIIYMVRLGPNNPTGEYIGCISLAQRLVGETVLPPDIGWCVSWRHFLFYSSDSMADQHRALLEDHMEKGYATEAASGLLRSLQECGFSEIIVFPSQTNPASNNVARKLHFIENGTIPDGDRPSHTYNIWTLPGMERIMVEGSLTIAPPK
jgi:RimJ/RimL family protein N-acetyltransferase